MIALTIEASAAMNYTELMNKKSSNGSRKQTFAMEGRAWLEWKG